MVSLIICFLSNRIFTFPKLGSKVQQTSIPLSYTPRKLVTNPASKLLYTIEADHRTLSPSAQAKLLADQRAADMDVDMDVVNLPVEIFGLPRAAAGNWASCIRIIDPVQVRPPAYPGCILHTHTSHLFFSLRLPRSSNSSWRITKLLSQWRSCHSILTPTSSSWWLERDKIRISHREHAKQVTSIPTKFCKMADH